MNSRGNDLRSFPLFLYHCTMKKISFLLFVTFAFISAYGQKCKLMSDEELREQKTYISLDEALEKSKYVYKLDLSASELQELPEDISKFKCLQVLDVQDNKLKKLPESLVKLKKLQYLQLKDNYLHALPIKMEKLKNLKRIDLRGNPINKEEIMRVQTLLPSCEILYDEN